MITTLLFLCSFVIPQAHGMEKIGFTTQEAARQFSQHYPQPVLCLVSSGGFKNTHNEMSVLFQQLRKKFNDMMFFTRISKKGNVSSVEFIIYFGGNKVWDHCNLEDYRLWLTNPEAMRQKIKDLLAPVVTTPTFGTFDMEEAQPHEATFKSEQNSLTQSDDAGEVFRSVIANPFVFRGCVEVSPKPASPLTPSPEVILTEGEFDVYESDDELEGWTFINRAAD
jgi:hypothetical protein